MPWIATTTGLGQSSIEFLDVGACNKRPAGANQNDGRNRRVIRGLLDGRCNAFRNTRTQRVDGRIIDGDEADAAFHCEFNKFNHEAKNLSQLDYGCARKTAVGAVYDRPKFSI